MEINDYTLRSIKTNIDDTFNGYSKGWNDAKKTKEYFRDLQKQLNNKISSQETKLKSMTNVNDQTLSNAISLATSGDIGIITTAIETSNNFGFINSLSQLVINSKNFKTNEIFSVKRLLQDAQKKNGYEKELDILNQANVLKVELDAFEDLTGTDGLKEVLSKVNMQTSTAELTYIRNKEKAERLV